MASCTDVFLLPAKNINPAGNYKKPSANPSFHRRILLRIYLRTITHGAPSISCMIKDMDWYMPAGNRDHTFKKADTGFYITFK